MVPPTQHRRRAAGVASAAAPLPPPSQGPSGCDGRLPRPSRRLPGPPHGDVKPPWAPPAPGRAPWLPDWRKGRHGGAQSPARPVAHLHAAVRGQPRSGGGITIPAGFGKLGNPLNGLTGFPTQYEVQAFSNGALLIRNGGEVAMQMAVQIGRPEEAQFSNHRRLRKPHHVTLPWKRTAGVKILVKCRAGWES